MSIPSPRSIALLVIAVGLSLACGITPLQPDEAYVSFRAAADLASGRGTAPEFAPGDAGRFDSPAWALALAAIVRRLGEPSVRWGAIALGLAGYLLTIAALGRDLLGFGSGPAGVHSWAALISLSLFAASPDAILGATNGLPVLILSATAAALALAISGALPLLFGIAAAALAAWIYPEGTWIAPAMLAQCAGARSLVPLGEGRGRRLLLALLAGAAALAAWRWITFGRVLPVSFAAWRGMAPGEWIRAVSSHADAPRIAILVCAILGALAGGRVYSGYLASGLSWLLVPMVAGGVPPSSSGRTDAAAFALLALAAGGLAMAAPMTSLKARAIALIVASTFVLSAGGAAILAGAAAREMRASERETNALGDWLARSGARSVALVETGRVGYRSGAEILDLGPGTIPGVEEPEAARLFRPDPPDYLILRLAQAPEGAGGSPRVSLASIPPELAMSRVERDLMADRRFEIQYRPLFLILYPRGETERGPRARLIAERADLRHVERAWPASTVLVDR